MRLKRYLGVATLVIFLGVLLGLGGVPQSFRTGIAGLFQESHCSEPESIRTTQLVEEESSTIDVVEKVSPSVVSVVVKSVGFDFFSGPTVSEEGIGTGFIVDPNGLIVTNSHVVDNVNGEYSVVLKDGTTYEVNKIHLDESTDLAILEITARNLPAVEFGDSDSLKVGQKAIAIGNALGRYQNTVTQGIVSGISRSLTATSGFGGAVKTYEGAIQTDAAINPGNSGGPLLNSSGQLIGINVATSYGADNISFAIPVNTLKPLLEGFLRDGKIVRPYLGVYYTIVTSEIATLRELPEGAFVSRVIVDSPAEKVGIKRGDIIVKFNGKDISEDFPLSKAISETKVGDKVELVIDRQGDTLTLNPVLSDAPESF